MWSFRRNWKAERERLRAELLSGRFRFGLLSRRTIKSGEEVDIWSARDSLVLKCLALGLEEALSISKRCYHLKDHGGSKKAVRDVFAALPRHRFVLRTDVHLYYASIEHQLLLDRLAAVIEDRRLLNLLAQYLMRSAERGGLFFDYYRGIALGCPLSPLMGAFFLRELDCELERRGRFFLRFMDDVLVLAETRWQLRRVVKAVNEILAALGLEKHPDKTFIGKIDKGFDFLGYHLNRKGISVSQKTLDNFIERSARLYEQERESAFAESSRLGQYVRRWSRWAEAGLRGVPFEMPPEVSRSLPLVAAA